ncbi:MAG: hypothetical protein IJE43_02870 [Alphaproteobacteria bacterium]|nr:hypothetical protein [Alphaproteobacteria bacterium]MBQ6886292.1 hypothetical protein [Lachnospiraceae bacterium]
MNDNTRTALINKEIETYRKFAVVLESLKPVIQSFDGKCINKKFAEAMDEFLFYGNTTERQYHVTIGIDTTSYGSMFDLAIRCYDDIVRGEADSSGYCSSYYISNRDFTMRVKSEEVTTTLPGGKPRINAKALSDKLDEKIQQLHSKAEALEKDLSHVEDMRADLEQIKQMMAAFNGKYHGRITEVFNCNYSLKDNNGMQYR